MDDVGRIITSVALGATLSLFALSGLVRASVMALLRQGNGGPLLLPAVERWRSLGPDAPRAIRGVRVLLALIATLLAAALVLSSLFSWSGLLVTFGLLLVDLAALEAGVRFLGKRYAASIAPWGAPSLVAVARAFRPLARLLLGEREPASPGESLLLEAVSGEAGEPFVADAQAQQMLRAVMNFQRVQVKEILIPRVDMVAVEVSDPPARAVDLALTHGYSRLPLYQDTVDQIVGIVYARDLLRYLQQGTVEQINLRELARPALFVPETKGVYELLREFQERRVHLAIVVDEYGGTAGLVTLEDILEEIVGEIEDEFQREGPRVEWVGEGEAIVDARLSLDDLQGYLAVEVQGEGFDTVGGFVYSQLGRVPNPGDRFTAVGLQVEVISTAGRRIRRVKVSRLKEVGEEEGEGPAEG